MHCVRDSSLWVENESTSTSGVVQPIRSCALRIVATTRYDPQAGISNPEDRVVSEAQNIATLERFVEEVINQGRFEAADELVEEDFVELDPLPGQKQGREGLKDVIRMMRTSFPDIHWVVQETIASGDKVVSRFKWTGTHRGDFLGIPATGRKITVPGVVIDRLKNGKMADSRILMDTLGMMQQLGVVPSPGNS